MDHIETRTDGGAEHPGMIPGRDAGREDTACEQAVAPGGGRPGDGFRTTTHATLEWCCDACKTPQRHAFWQDGRPVRVACAACRGAACLLIPDGPAMRRPDRPRHADVECAACGARFPAGTRGCHRCDGGQAVPFAEGRAI